MEKNIIIKKLRKFLQNHPKLKEECEVIYLMVEIRKILDYERNQYRTLRFYCNWVLHNKLSQEKTTRLLADIFNSNIDFKKDEHKNASNLKAINADFFKLDTLKKELEDFFKVYNLPMDLFDKNWWPFGKLLLEIIKDCSIVFVPNKIRGLSVIKYDDKKFGYKFSLINSKKKLVIKLKFK